MAWQFSHRYLSERDNLTIEFKKTWLDARGKLEARKVATKMFEER
jgi:hypothetical protein